MSGTIVVGADSSPESRIALAWALREAADRAAAVLITHVRPYHSADGVEMARRDGRLVLSEANAYARDVAPHVPVDKRLAIGDTARELLTAASGADLLVIGARGGLRSARSALGSTARDLAAQACLPLAVIGRVPRHAHNRIVLGVDTLHPDSTPTRYAFEAARRTGARLALVYAGAIPQAGTGTGTGTVRKDDPEAARKAQEAALGRIADLWSARYPRTRINHHVVPGMGDSALVAASRGADLLVIGGRRPQPSHHTGRFTHAVLSYAACPVVIVPHRTRGDCVP